MINSHIPLLRQKVRSFLATFSERQNEVIYAQFAPHLFIENGEKLAFYLAQVEQTLAQLELALVNDQLAVEFYAQKILAQCTALNEALSRETWKASNSLPKQAQFKSVPLKKSHPVHDLPPRERLTKYYEFLTQFNQMIEQAQDAKRVAVDDNERAIYGKKIERLQVRREKCLQSIETLEAYLVFKQQKEQENG